MSQTASISAFCEAEKKQRDWGRLAPLESREEKQTRLLTFDNVAKPQSGSTASFEQAQPPRERKPPPSIYTYGRASSDAFRRPQMPNEPHPKHIAERERRQQEAWAEKKKYWKRVEIPEFLYDEQWEEEWIEFRQKQLEKIVWMENYSKLSFRSGSGFNIVSCTMTWGKNSMIHSHRTFKYPATESQIRKVLEEMQNDCETLRTASKHLSVLDSLLLVPPSSVNATVISALSVNFSTQAQLLFASLFRSSLPFP